MKILLINVDSKIPNLALMKISTYHKSMGDDVGFHIKNPDKIYVSIIFKKNIELIDSLKWRFPNSEINIGGSGHDLVKKLPDKIEYLKPDYSLYPDIDYSLGYTTRGCNRSCGFCIVPQKEGKFKIAQHPSHFYDNKFKKIVFLDNNILLDKKWFIEVINFCKINNLSVDFNQGLDIRLCDEDIIKILTTVRFHNGYRFAFDNSGMCDLIKEKCKLLKKHGINIRSNVQFYVYVSDDSMYDDGVWRCRFLKELNTNPFVQFNIDNIPSKRISKLRRWGNRKHAFWSCDINEYYNHSKIIKQSYNPISPIIISGDEL